MACTCSTSRVPKSLRKCGVFSFLTSRSASCHSGVQFLISHPATCVCTRPSTATKLKKTQCFMIFLSFRTTWSSFSYDSVSSVSFVSYCSHHCCCIWPKSEVYGNLSSKFPSAKNHHLQCDDLLLFAFLKHIFSNKFNSFKICIDLDRIFAHISSSLVPPRSAAGSHAQRSPRGGVGKRRLGADPDFVRRETTGSPAMPGHGSLAGWPVGGTPKQWGNHEIWWDFMGHYWEFSGTWTRHLFGFSGISWQYFMGYNLI